MRCAFLLSGVFVAVLGCSEWQTGGNIGGANQGLRGPGNRQGGIALSKGEVAVDARGRLFATLEDGRLVVGTMDSQTTQTVDVDDVQRVAFWEGQDTDGVYVLAGRQSKQDMKEVVLSWSFTEGRVMWTRELARGDRWLDVNALGTHLVLTGEDVMILRAQDGSDVVVLRQRNGVRDVDFSASGTQLVITEETAWRKEDGQQRPHTDVSVHDLDTGEERCRTDTLNCADELVLSADGTRAFLAPTLCAKDPVSVVTLGADGSCSLEKQLPGFGALAMSPDGKTAVAFLDAYSNDDLGPQVPADVRNSEIRYHLMFIDVATLEYRTTPFGESLPRYTYSPDGSTLIVDTPMAPLSRVVLMDVQSFGKRTVRGLPAKLHRFSVTPDGERVFVVDKGLFELDLGKGDMAPVLTRFRPGSLNITPGGNTLLVGDGRQRVVHFLDTGSNRETDHVSY